VTAERDVWVTERETLTEELISRNETMSQLEHRNHDLDLQLQQTVSYLKISEAKLSEQNPMLSLLKESEKQIQALESTLNEKVAQITSLEQRVENMNSSSMNGDILQDDWLSIRQQVDMLNQALQSTRDRLAVREADVDCLRADLRELRHHPTPVDIAFSSVVASSDSSSLVARAAKLRRSESIREAALQRLESERDASIEALRRLSESVSKYYNNKK
jgi:chromosome segregation ATPase